ncbi:hypothetical protein F5Y16DRAFT_401394 [Xylariaceae sp. FL0255]|nr:hypothetical protein F5Y16DRAFT_401394 [Xylariaceae sp. FL0255]
MAKYKPEILLISFDLAPWFDETFGFLLSELMKKAKVKRVKTPTAALPRIHASPPPAAILITDPSVTEDVHAGVWDAVLQYVVSGGTVVLMGEFSARIEPQTLTIFLRKLGLPWKAGVFHRTTVVLNNDAVNDQIAAALMPKYSQKACFLKNVPHGDVWYKPHDTSVVEALVYPPPPVNHEQAAIAMGSVGEGRVGYVGDVNAENGSDIVVLAMCSLLK